MTDTHEVIEPKIFYFGTPVVLISTRNEDGSANLAPMSSAWWLGQSCMLGLGTRSKTVENLRREGECVLNLPSSDMVGIVDRLACTTGKDPMPEYKQRMNFRHVKHKFEEAGVTPMPSKLVKPPRVAECPVQLEAVVQHMHAFADGFASSIEVRIVRTYMSPQILNAERRHHVDPDKWQPLIMSFLEFYGLSGNIHPSKLAQVF